MRAILTLLRRIRDDSITQRTKRAIANRECRHDGSAPMCDRCAAFYNAL